MSKPMFTSSDKEFYADSPYYALTITINLLYTEIPVKIMVNKENRFINLSRIFEDLQKGLKFKQTDFKDFQNLKSTHLYVDVYSLMYFGHVHYTYNSQNIYGVPDTEIFSIDPKNIPIRSGVKGKNSNTLKISSIQQFPNEIYGEYNNKKGEFHGQFGDYRLVPKIMSYISPSYEMISDEFVRYLYSCLFANETKNKQQTNEIIQADTVQSNNDFMKSFFQHYAILDEERQKRQAEQNRQFIKEIFSNMGNMGNFINKQ
jgi:hypothetical protein